MALSTFSLTPERALSLLLGAHTIGRSRVTRESACSKGARRVLTMTPNTFDVS
jgi:hypothetical protein